jgi:tetratricopeptide (TPR) repeat protein
MKYYSLFYLFFVLLCACKDAKINEDAEKMALSSVDSAVEALKIQKQEPIKPNKHNKPQKLANTILDTQTAEILFAKGLAEENNENYTKASKLYSQAILADSTFAEAFFHLALVDGALDKHQQAITNYQKAIQYHYKKPVDAYANLAYQYLATQKYADARTNFQKAVNLEEDAENYAGLAIACFYLQDLPNAQTAYLKAAQFDADFLQEDVKNAVSLKYLFTEKEMFAITELANKTKK